MPDERAHIRWPLRIPVEVLEKATLARLVQRQWRLLATIAALTVCDSFAVALQPWPLKLLIDSLGSPSAGLPHWPLLTWILAHGPAAAVLAAGAATLCIYLAVSALGCILSWLWCLLGQRLVFDLSTTLFDHLLRRSVAYHQRHSPGDALSRISGDAWSIYSLTAQLFVPAAHLFSIATIGVFAWQLNPRLAAISLVAAPLLALTTGFFGERLKTRTRLEREAESEVSSFVHQTLSAMPMIQVFSSEDRNARRFNRLAANAAYLARQRAVVTSAFGMVNGLITTIGSVLVTYFGALQVMDGTLSVGGLVVFIAYVHNLQTAAEGLLKVYGELKPVQVSLERVWEVLEPEPGKPVDRSGAQDWTGNGPPDLALENVSFGYEPGSPVLRDVSVRIQAGTMTAFVGQTGAGKSSLVSLIPRFFDPKSGSVTINGQDVREFTLASLRGQIAFVLQEPFLFPVSVADNIAYANPAATREQIEAAARVARADEFIRKLPSGFDTILEQGGGGLSGGERQRIAIARAVLKDAPILVLDEPTSALDAGTEAEVMRDIAEIMEGRTCLVIAHRLSAVRRAGQICLLSGGRIVESGRHEELLAAGGPYARLYQFQSGAAGAET